MVAAMGDPFWVTWTTARLFNKRATLDLMATDQPEREQEGVIEMHRNRTVGRHVTPTVQVGAASKAARGGFGWAT
ncbi:hypothetical protein [Actinomadura harenae]|uniref:hypothetical protein n=1 Tax=Actinomadura harenae TaxID=2483351 RepID=UPI0011C45F50|nr:hypothetical protein [Actinomadura harenae]